MFNSDYITIDNPNIVPTSLPAIPVGKRIDVLAPFRQMEELEPMRNVDVSELYLPNVTLRTMSGKIGTNAVFVNKHNTGADLVASCLFLDGQVVSTVRGEKHGVELGRGRQSIKYDPHSEFMHWCKAGTPFNIAHFSIQPSFLFGLLPENESWAEGLKEQIASRRRVITDVPPQITLAQHKALQNILNCPLDGKLGLLMMETSIIQIILLQLHVQFQAFDNRRVNLIDRRSTHISHDVKEHLDNTFLEDHSISALATFFGTNTSKLMNLFRQAFGMTIFEYIHELRMEHAKALILDKGYYVAEAAREVGYKNPHHFSTAFKKKHGITPSSLKNQG